MDADERRLRIENHERIIGSAFKLAINWDWFRRSSTRMH